jgi:rhodanese-related sulfurtransferase
VNLIFYVLIVLVVGLYLRRTLKIRSLKQYRASDVDDLLRSRRGEIILLDVRTAPERKAGAIRGSIHIPLQSLRSRLGELEKYKGKEIVCYCQSGNRSVSAALLLRGNGFAVANLRGGIAEWNSLSR